MSKRIIILGGIVLFVVLAWTTAWFVLAGVIRSNVEAQASNDGVTAPRLACGNLDIRGFPFRFDVYCTEGLIQSGDIAVALPLIRASVRVYAPTHMLVSAEGPLNFTDAFTGTRNRVAWTTLDGSIRLTDWRIARVSVAATDLVWSDTLVGETVVAQAPLAELHLLDIPEQHDAEHGLAALAGYLRTEGVSYPGMTLTDTNAELELELTAVPDDVRSWNDPALLPTWQANDGELRVVSLRGTDADAQLTAAGGLRLDQAGQVNGQIDIQSTGVAERIGPLLEEPWRTLVLGVPAPDGSYTNQLNFESGTILSGLVPIATIPPLF